MPNDGKPFSFEKIMINKKLFELINYLIENKIINTLAEEEEGDKKRQRGKNKYKNRFIEWIYFSDRNKIFFWR